MITIKFIGRSLTGSERIGPFLRSIFGIGFVSSYKVCKHAGLSYNARMDHISTSKLVYIESNFVDTILDQDLRRQVQNRIADRIRIGGYRGFRISLGLPSRGQRTKTNAKTCKRKSSKKS